MFLLLYSIYIYIYYRYIHKLLLIYSMYNNMYIFFFYACTGMQSKFNGSNLLYLKRSLQPFCWQRPHSCGKFFHLVKENLSQMLLGLLLSKRNTPQPGWRWANWGYHIAPKLCRASARAGWSDSWWTWLGFIRCEGFGIKCPQLEAGSSIEQATGNRFNVESCE